MPEVQSITPANYAMPMSQYATEPQTEDNTPMLYEPEMEEKRNAAANHKGATAKAALAIAGIGLSVWLGHKWGASGKSELKEANKAMKEALTDINKESKEFLEKNPVKRAWKNKEYAQSVENRSKSFVEEVEKDAEDASCGKCFKKKVDETKKPPRRPTHF